MCGGKEKRKHNKEIVPKWYTNMWNMPVRYFSLSKAYDIHLLVFYHIVSSLRTLWKSPWYQCSLTTQQHFATWRLSSHTTWSDNSLQRLVKNDNVSITRLVSYLLAPGFEIQWNSSSTARDVIKQYRLELTFYILTLLLTNDLFRRNISDFYPSPMSWSCSPFSNLSILNTKTPAEPQATATLSPDTEMSYISSAACSWGFVNRDNSFPVNK